MWFTPELVWEIRGAGKLRLGFSYFCFWDLSLCHQKHLKLLDYHTFSFFYYNGDICTVAKDGGKVDLHQNYGPKVFHLIF